MTDHADVLTPAEVAQELGISAADVRRLEAGGVIGKATKRSGSRRRVYTRADVDAVKLPDLFDQAAAYTRDDLNDCLTREGRAWLYAHRLLWLRALTVVQFDAEAAIGEDRMAHTGLKPPPGASGKQVAAWLPVKAGLDRRNAERQHFLQRVKARREVVKAMVGPVPVAESFLAGEVVDAVVKLAELTRRGEFGQVLRFANELAGKWTDADGTAA